MGIVMKKIYNYMIVRKVFIITILTLAIISATNDRLISLDLVPSMTVLPKDTVEVGEEVFFSAANTNFTDKKILDKARYEWDFGDGYYLRFDPAEKTITRSGIAVTHYFMKPGDFTVKLTVTLWNEWNLSGSPVGDPIALESTSCVIHVTGEAPMQGFEIQHAPFHNRLAQYLYVQIPEAYRVNDTMLRVSLEGSKGSKRVLMSKINLSEEEVVFLDHRPLSQDQYLVLAELIDANNKRIFGGIWKDKFSKRYEGIPKVGIDENNAFRLKGEFFFPIAAFMIDETKIKGFVDAANINILATEGYYTKHDPSSWRKYLDEVQSNNVMAIGPGRGDYSVGLSPNRWKFNHKIDRMAEYVKLNKGHRSMFAWIWQDEPNMGGRAQKVYPPTLAAWAYVCHLEDPQHLAYNGFYGTDWLKLYGTQPNVYDYLGSETLFGGKKWMQDVFSFDIYPIAARLHPSLNYIDIGPYAAYLDAVNRVKLNNKNLSPFMPAINPGNRKADGFMHTEEQVYLEGWINVVHGAKGIVWFPYFDPSSIRWQAMKKFADQMKALAPVVLQAEPDRKVSDSADEALKRVDTMIREYDDAVYLFAARVTEPDPVEGSKYRGIEPDSISVKFFISGLEGVAEAEVVDEGRKIALNNGQFNDNFDKNAVHIYKIHLAPKS
jgi:hypothetical protein